ncbi:hypothetical protein DQ238_14160 [Geodermatophilus sp. TF02-6]|uniref:hypothetical protein n=1 Tax=Geodermatophilus sp. TF02-6 TaxID=2250575 RepID=UPI000E069095|nr:hypothetical protein [Geodermatophilus sp. TF02-6]RBY77803.1 hypothetical protein DQ238_14160 [Geodermatophilus sp. TF02-6]
MTRPVRCRRLLPAAAALLVLAACSADRGTSPAPASAPPPAGEDATGAATGTGGAPVPSTAAAPDTGADDADEADEADDADGDAEAGAADAGEDTEAEPVATDPPRPAATDVVLTLAGWDPASGAVLASGYVSPVVEDGGTCTLELRRDDEAVTATGEGLADATTTVCGDLRVPGSDLAAGEWSAVLRYESDTGVGESAALTVEVPA